MAPNPSENLPYSSSFYDRHGKLRWRFRRGRVTITLPGDPRLEEFHQRYLDVVAYSQAAQAPKSGRLKAPKKASPVLVTSALLASFNSSRKRAKETGKSFTITTEDVLDLSKRQLNRCALSGIHFQPGKMADGRRDPRAPSIDRIDCSRGYELDNIRLVLHAVNIGLNMWGDELFLQICAGRLKMAG
jgi:hypothetical protein